MNLPRNDYLRKLAIFLFYIDHLVFPIMADNNVIVGAESDPESIVGGHESAIGKWPWIAVIFRSINQPHCDGSLIDDRHILTAAHCTKKITAANIRSFTVHLGDHNIQTDSEARHIVRRLAQVVQHEDFTSEPYLNNDVAIITMDAPVQFTASIKPISLPSKSQLYVGRTATVIGWGYLAADGPGSAVLQEVSIPILSNSECAAKHQKSGFGPSVLCAGSAWKSSCHGDSGGPLMVQEASRWIQVGIVSWGPKTCGDPNFPGVYASVTQFLPWIRRHLR